ncbi:2,3-diaminopropionate biosynthesis protein SbnA [Pendulispora rubella]|uniref:2,3-diaminopropionate biosynthesis protein SbnA n=1 Tax=Pendulispora rubella TaxID=2741070 RepID=A0ABZ2L737_9BACT
MTATLLAHRFRDVLAPMRETPVVPIEDPKLDLHVKLEYCNIAGSIKCRPALWMLKSAIERGEIDEQTTLVESSSGNFALALAVYCRMLGLPLVPVIDPNVTRLNEAMLRSLCASVVKVVERDDTGGFLKTRLAEVHALRERLPRVFWPDQYHNADAVAAHYHLTGAEIARRFDRLDFVFLGVSTAGTIAGVSRRLKERFPSVKIIAVDTEGSVIFGGPPKRRHIPGLGSSIVPALLADALIDDVVMVSEQETVLGCRTLFHRHRLFAGGSTGTVYAAIQRYFETNPCQMRPTVLFLCADRGTAYLDTVYDDTWMAGLLERDFVNGTAEHGIIR